MGGWDVHEVQILKNMEINRKMHYMTNTENSKFAWDSVFWNIWASLGLLVTSKQCYPTAYTFSCYFTVQLTGVELDSV